MPSPCNFTSLGSTGNAWHFSGNRIYKTRTDEIVYPQRTSTLLSISSFLHRPSTPSLASSSTMIRVAVLAAVAAALTAAPVAIGQQIYDIVRHPPLLVGSVTDTSASLPSGRRPGRDRASSRTPTSARARLTLSPKAPLVTLTSS